MMGCGGAGVRQQPGGGVDSVEEQVQQDVNVWHFKF